MGSLYTGLADILRERNALDAALDRATRGISLATDLGAVRAERWIEWHVCDLLVLARIKQAQGDLDGALTLVHEAQDKLKGFGAISFAALLAAFEAQLHQAQGDLDSAVQWLRSVQAHEASIAVRSTPGEGAEFILELKGQAAEAPVRPPQTLAGKAAHG